MHTSADKPKRGAQLFKVESRISMLWPMEDALRKCYGKIVKIFYGECDEALIKWEGEETHSREKLRDLSLANDEQLNLTASTTIQVTEDQPTSSTSANNGKQSRSKRKIAQRSYVEENSDSAESEDVNFARMLMSISS